MGQALLSVFTNEDVIEIRERELAQAKGTSRDVRSYGKKATAGRRANEEPEKDAHREGDR